MELKPCPFCGSDADIHTMPSEGNCNDGGMFVMCRNGGCMASSALVFPLMDNVQDLLIERWNKRVRHNVQGKGPARGRNHEVNLAGRAS